MKNFLQKVKDNKFASVVTIILVLIIGWYVISNTSNSFGSYSRGMAVPGMVDTAYDSESYSNSVQNIQAPTSYSKSLGTQATSESIQKTDKKIVKNGSLSLLVEKSEDAVKKIQDIAESAAGSVDSVNIYNVTDSTKAGRITVRVPNDKFNGVMVAIKAVATKVENEKVDTTDVTAQYVDLEARLANYRAVETQYVQILKSARNVDETLSVYQRLSEVRQNIESIQGQINYLSRQVTMSTISVSLTSEADVQVFGIVWRPLTVLKQSFRSLLVDLTNLVNDFIIFIFWLPGFIIKVAFFGLVIFLGWKLIKWLKRKFGKGNQISIPPVTTS